ncbi:MAG: ribosome small subunit-dependent GTPase A [Halioglobus sp.]|nr:ribosome small subunit-dependent GTPase A [Halioglobus sp.]
MGKRKPTPMQTGDIENNQAWRPQRAARRIQAADETLVTDGLGPEQEGLITAHYGTQVEVEALTGERQRCHVPANLEGLVTGDHALWCAGDPYGVVVAQLERTSQLQRPDSTGSLQPMAANIGRIFVVVAPVPEPSAIVIDRYLVAASAVNIEPVILLNKTDLLAANNDLKDMLERLLAPYENLDYQVVRASATEGELDELRAALADCTSVFVGQAGVGKSSLLQALLPNGAVQYTDEGMHGGTNAVLSHLPGGGSVIDSPGIREFGLWQLSLEEVSLGFREMRPYMGHCRFSNCSHLHEPGCALIDALASGNISQARLDSYRHIVAGLRMSSI